MALGPWVALYTSVIDELMAQRRERAMLMLMAIARHCDPFGQCFPGRARLRKLRHCSKTTQMSLEEWLVEYGYIRVTEVYNPRRRQTEPYYQVSPCVVYVRPDIQEYCEAVFSGALERDFGYEDQYLVNLFSTKESQAEESDSESRFKNQNQNQNQGTTSTSRHHNQLSAPRAATGKKQPQNSTMRNAAQTGTEQPAAAPQREAPNSEGQSAGRDYDALFQKWYYELDDEELARELRTAVSTSIAQARQAVAGYARDSVLTVAIKALKRRDRGELTNPGAWFFTTLKKEHQDLEGLRIEAEDASDPGEMEI